MVVKIDSFIKSFDNVTKKIVRDLQKWVNQSLEKRKDYAEMISPTDTWEYIRSHKIQEAVVIWNKIVWANVNDALDAFIVEFGARQLPVNRHKWPPRNAWTIIYRWVGANVYQRMNFDTKQDVEKILSKSVKW